MAYDVLYAWVKPDGEIIDAAVSHWQELINAGIVSPDDTFDNVNLVKSYTPAFAKGWARISGDAVQFQGKLTPIQADAIEHYLADQGFDTVFADEVNRRVNRYVPINRLSSILTGGVARSLQVAGSWYRMLKQAVLMTHDDVENKGMTYYDVGHQNFTNSVKPKNKRNVLDPNLVEEIWAIIKGPTGAWEFKHAPASGRKSHNDLWGGASSQGANVVAKGRYSKSPEFPDGQCTFVRGVDFNPLSSPVSLQDYDPQRAEFLEKKIVSLLERQYGPKVVIWPM